MPGKAGPSSLTDDSKLHLKEGASGHLETRTPGRWVGHGGCIGEVSKTNTGNWDPIPLTKLGDMQNQEGPPENSQLVRQGQSANLHSKHQCMSELLRGQMAKGLRGLSFV